MILYPYVRNEKEEEAVFISEPIFEKVSLSTQKNVISLSIIYSLKYHCLEKYFSNYYFEYIQDIPDYEPSSTADLFENSSSLTEEAEVIALRRKKALLERVMKRLRELIIASQPKGMFYMFEKYESNLFIYHSRTLAE